MTVFPGKPAKTFRTCSEEDFFQCHYPNLGEQDDEVKQLFSLSMNLILDLWIYHKIVNSGQIS